MKFHFETILPGPGESFVTEEMVAPTLDCVYHIHPECELTWIESGFGSRFIGDSIEPFSAGDLVLIGGSVPHHYLTLESDSTGPEWSRTRVVKFAPAFCGKTLLELPEFEAVARMLQEAARGLHFPEESAREAVPLLQKLFRERGARRLLTLLELLELLSRLPRRPLSGTVIEPEAAPDERLNRVLQLIHRRLAQGRPIPLAEAAAEACLTPTAFSRYFRRATRKRFIDYVTELKLSRAAGELARSDRPIVEIAFESGFSNLSNFNRQFQNSRKMTPRAYRNSFRRIDLHHADS